MSGCRHHWLIEPPNGSTSRGRCRLCDEEREFTNWSAQGKRILTASEKAAVTRTRREEAALTSLIHDFGQDGYKPLTAFRRNNQRVGEL